MLTSNRTRDLHDALKRRCLYHWIDYPTPQREVEIVLARAPGGRGRARGAGGRAVARMRELDLVKKPGVAEAIDWVAALTVLGVDDARRDDAAATLGAVIKDHDDQLEVEERLDEILGAAP